MISRLKQFEKKKLTQRRFDKTYQFVSKTLPSPAKIFDMGTPNDLSDFLIDKGYIVTNTSGEDLDLNPEALSSEGFDAVTSFEILEHCVNPMSALKVIKAPRLYASVPLTLWFSKAYRSKTDPWDRHFHEFEDWQFEWLLEKSGWKIVRSEKWTNPSYIPGIRPIFRLITPRYFIVEAVRK
ncbi:MAG: methyltransferase [Cyclobacteriaceae bacterium]